MEAYKLKYLEDFVERTNSNVEELLRANLESFVDLVFMSVVDDLFNKWELLEMYILDGCFIIELFLKNKDKLGKANDPLFKSKWVLYALSRDLILLDSQLPFCVLTKLWEHWRLTTKSNQDDADHLKLITRLASRFLNVLLRTRN